MSAGKSKMMVPAAVLLVSAHCSDHVAFGTRSPDSSMHPVISCNDNVVVRCTDSFRTGDIVVLKNPKDHQQS